MKRTKYLIIPLMLLLGNSSFAQKDSSVSFKVYGACELCKTRIEEVVKTKGVKSGVWDVNTKFLALVYDPAVISLDKIEDRIVGVGHDLETKKAKDAVYNDLPACCHYRELDKKEKEEKQDTINASNRGVKGLVLESDRKGSFIPLQGASIVWMGTTHGTLTDASGIFNIPYEGSNNMLIVSYAGYASDTLTITAPEELKIILATDKQLGEVVVNARLRSTYLSSSLATIRTEVMTDKELFKAACCNLSESFETNPSVDVSYNDAITGSKQIQLLGLSGIYTQLTVENLPGPRGLATPLGLNSIAGPWVESIQLTKGIGSVANGYESIAGQINIELKKPENSEKLFANLYVNENGKTDLNLNLSAKTGKKWSTALLLHDDFLANKELDINKDGFRDLPSGNQFSLINRWKYDGGKGWMSQFGIKMLLDRRTGGEIAFNPSLDKGTSNHYGLGINTDRYELFGKIGYIFPRKKYKSIGLQLSVIDHRQDSYFGLINYTGKQQSLYGNLIYQSIINTTVHKFRTGFSFLYDKYDESYRTTSYHRTEIVSGAFFEYTFTPDEKFSLIAGMRIDHDNLYGFFATPRLHMRYEPVKGTTIRMSAGRGQRTANIFAENMSVFASSRQLDIISLNTGKAYGLNPEIAWNKGFSIDQKIKFFHRDGSLGLDFFRNDFSNQVVVDLEDPREVKFYNLQGKSYSNSFQASLNAEPFLKFDIRLAYRFFDVKTNYSDGLKQRPLVAAHRAFANLAYAINGWKLDYTLSYNSKKRIPGTNDNPFQYRRGLYSPAFTLMNMQVTKSFGKKQLYDFYIGAENLGNFHQKDAIIAADQPFGPYFDASLVWGPVNGRMIYVGWRYRVK